jgi:hypothetical protein
MNETVTLQHPQFSNFQRRPNTPTRHTFNGQPVVTRVTDSDRGAAMVWLVGQTVVALRKIQTSPRRVRSFAIEMDQGQVVRRQVDSVEEIFD